MRATLVLILTALTTACAAAPNVSLPPNESAVPSAVMSLVHDKWKDAKVVSTPIAACPGGSATTAPLLVTDLNGDGLPDFVFRVTAASAPHLMVAMTHLDGYVLSEIAVSGDHASDPILLAQRGRAYREASNGLDLFFGTDTLTAGCGASRAGYFWTGTDFDTRQIIVAPDDEPAEAN